MHTRWIANVCALVLGLVLALGCSSETGGGHSARAGGIAWSPDTFENALVRAKSEQKLVFVDFNTSWCGWCKRLDQDTFSDVGVIRALNEHYVSISIDAESKTGAPIAQRYKVNGFPTLLFIAPDGTVRHKIGGYVPADRFQQELARIESAR